MGKTAIYLKLTKCKNVISYGENGYSFYAYEVHQHRYILPFRSTLVMRTHLTLVSKFNLSQSPYQCRLLTQEIVSRIIYKEILQLLSDKIHVVTSMEYDKMF